MIAIVSRDQFFYAACSFLFPDVVVVLFKKMSDYVDSKTRPEILIVDLLCGDGFSFKMASEIREIDAGQIVILCSFKVSRMITRSPVFFIYRNTSVEMYRKIIKDIKSVICIKEPQFSIMQIEVMRQHHKCNDDKKITDILGISYATLRIHKYNIMLKLRLKKMCHIVNTVHHGYITDY